jgi:hypothetical protein
VTYHVNGKKDVISHVVAHGKAVGVPDCMGWLPRETGTCEAGPTRREAGAGASGSSVGTALTRDLANSPGDLVDGACAHGFRLAVACDQGTGVKNH